MDRLGDGQQMALSTGAELVLLVSAQLRKPMRQITSRFFPDLAVISYSELRDRCRRDHHPGPQLKNRCRRR